MNSHRLINQKHPAPFIEQLSTQEWLPLLASYQLLPDVLREMLLDRAIADWEQTSETLLLTSEEITAAYQAFCQQHHLTSTHEQQAWLQNHGLPPQHLEAVVTRKLKIQKFKQAKWGNKLESYFLSRKRQLDRVVYSLLRTSDPELAQELYFRIQAGEQSFADLAQTYSQGPEALTNGILGPVELGTLHLDLARLLAVSQPSQLWSPKPFGEWWVIVRLERILPAQLNEFMRQRLLNELFETWLQKQFQEVSELDQRQLNLTAH
ncbi:peptidylprolyl isomerase [Leptolyngbya sp. DQ-M1]|uniref:peptidylprolyl isomerase n=1 Tax=Leptolyngbya sp. DQ-M1 TaxID=2933920 RepID=UPI0032986A5A